MTKRIKFWLWKTIVFLAVFSLVGCKGNIPLMVKISEARLGDKRIDVYGKLVWDGNSTVETVGFCHGFDSLPDVSGNIIISTLDKKNNFYSKITLAENLPVNVYYYIRAFAINKKEISYSPPIRVRNYRPELLEDKKN